MTDDLDLHPVPDGGATPTARRLRAEALTLGYGGNPIVEGLDLEFPAGRVTALIGANGSGKSTIFKGLSRLIRPSSGRVLLDERPVDEFGAREYARCVGLLPQHPIAPEGITVAELVGRGRAPHRGPFARASKADHEHVARALVATRTQDLAERAVDSLSGGQRQRVWIAMALAQDPQVLLLDEPTTFLDVAHQLDVLELLRAWNAERGTTIVMVLHELMLAARAADHLVALRDGRVVREGTPAEVLTREVVREVYELEAEIIPDPVRGTPLVIPMARTAR